MPGTRGQPKIEARGSAFSTRLTLKDAATGRSIQRRVTAATPELVQIEVGRIRAAWHDGRYVTPNRTPLTAWLEAWLRGYDRAPSTRQGHEATVRLYVADHALGDTPLYRLRPVQLQAWVDELRADGLSSGTVRRAFATVRAGLNHAVRLQVLATNPCAGVTLPRVQRRQWVILSRAEVTRLLDGTRGERYHALWTLALMLGLRIGELVALRWSDIDLARGTLVVQRTVQRGLDGRYHLVSVTKSSTGQRTLTLPPRCVAALRECRALQNERRLAAGRVWMDSGAVFDKTAGEHWTNPTGLWWVWREVQTRLEVPTCRQCGTAQCPKHDQPACRLHDCRHTALTTMLAAGVPLADVAQLAGHSSPTVTLGLYAHYMPDMAAHWTATIDGMYAQSGTRTDPITDHG